MITVIGLLMVIIPLALFLLYRFIIDCINIIKAVREGYTEFLVALFIEMWLVIALGLILFGTYIGR